MTKAGFSHIVTILDRSGSMTPLTAAVISGYNEFIKAQRAEPGTATVTLIQFDNEYEVVYQDRNLAECPDITMETYQPRGSTALLDAIGRTINQVGANLAALQEDERPSKVIVVIYTDGEENASRIFMKREEIFAMITEQREKWNWEFLFLGANQDAIGAAVAMGIPNAANFVPTPDSMINTFATASSTVASVRSGGSASLHI